MGEKIFLEGYRSEFSNNVENTIDLEFSTKTRLLPNNSISDEFSLLEQYNRERDTCSKFRLIFNINPICSNILFNRKTEIVVNEGAPNCVAILDNNKFTLNMSEYAPNAFNKTTPITHIQAIRNTEYSHKECGNFVYHCGIDIFNNHMLRKKDFVHVNKYNSNSESDSKFVYNTINDYCRDSRGDIIKENLNAKYNKNNLTNMHLYQYDTIYKMEDAFADNCEEKDGWWGFINPNTIEIENNNGKTIYINRMMANNKSCEFIDLYPDRSLFSFTPKYNKYRLRTENNWDYCITYPYKKDELKINEICGGEEQAIKANIKFTYNTASIPIIQCASYFKHNLKVGDYVTFYYYLPYYSNKIDTIDKLVPIFDPSKNEYNLYKESDIDENGNIINGAEIYWVVKKEEMIFTSHNVKVRVSSIGDDNGHYTDRIFNVKYEDIGDIYEYMEMFGCFYKKNSSNTECSYYFRKLKKLKNINGDELRSENNKVGFSRNIYGDEVSQIIFMDDVDVDGLLDHNNKPVSELFLTIVKSNRGYKKWYADRPNFTDEDIEFSHCFGKITSAIDFCGIEKEPFDYNIHFAHNMDKPNNMTAPIRNTFSAWGETVMSGTPKTLENDITIDMDEFYGDIVEYDFSIAKETIIGQVYHRFNTAQRECWSDAYRDIRHDEITSDDYDYANGMGKPFSVSTYFMNNVKTIDDEKGAFTDLMYGNISPEGYFYNPHNRFKIREEDDYYKESSARPVNYNDVTFDKYDTYLLLKQNGSITYHKSQIDAILHQEDGDDLVYQGTYYEITIQAPTNYGFIKGDFLAFYNKNTKETNWGELINVSGNILTLRCDESAFTTIENMSLDYLNPINGNRCIYVYWTPDSVPSYAKLSEGKHKFVWRPIVPPSQMLRDDELFDTTFANGRFYIERNFNLFLKRQDPHGIYGLSKPMYKHYVQEISNPMQTFNIKGGARVDLTDFYNEIKGITDSCI